MFRSIRWLSLFVVLFGACNAPVQPNIVLIVTDDQHVNTLDTMPAVQALQAQGVTFLNAFVTTPLCCPSRASILTGLRAPNHGVEMNTEGPDLDVTTTLAYVLQADGYETGLFGKYLNLYTPEFFPIAPPAGWDRWFALFNMEQYYNYDINEDGAVIHKGSTPADYFTDVISAEAVEFVSSAPTPFFAYVAPTAPHEPATPAVRHAGTFDGRPCPTTPATLEEDTSDKPSYINEWRGVFPPDIQATNCAAQNHRRESLLAVDEMVAAIVQAVAARGDTVLKNTIFIFTSDNGIGDLEHWWPWKMVPYEASIRVPMVVRYDKWVSPKGVTRAEPVLNIDIAPTLAEITGVPLAVEPDGLDWSELYAGNTSCWRIDFPIEYVSEPGSVFEVFNPSWTGVRALTWKYARYADGFEELYDLTVDPYELVNLAYVEPAPPLLAVARTRHDELH